jgi:hypothetical protein
VTHALLCFASTFVAVFALGLQSLNVNQGHYLAAGITSLGISLGHIGLYKYMPDANLAAIAGYLAGGVLGIVTSMWFHRVAKDWLLRKKADWLDPMREERASRKRDTIDGPRQPGAAWIKSHDYDAAGVGHCGICGHSPHEHVNTRWQSADKAAAGASARTTATRSASWPGDIE